MHKIQNIAFRGPCEYFRFDYSSKCIFNFLKTPQGVWRHTERDAENDQTFHHGVFNGADEHEQYLQLPRTGDDPQRSSGWRLRVRDYGLTIMYPQLVAPRERMAIEYSST